MVDKKEELEKKVTDTIKEELTDEEKNIEEQETKFHDIEEETPDEVIDIEW